MVRYIYIYILYILYHYNPLITVRAITVEYDSNTSALQRGTEALCHSFGIDSIPHGPSIGFWMVPSIKITYLMNHWYPLVV